MNDTERPAFGASEVIEITSKFEADDDAFIVRPRISGRGSTETGSRT
jgi:hypothetical protein